MRDDNLRNFFLANPQWSSWKSVIGEVLINGWNTRVETTMTSVNGIIYLNWVYWWADVPIAQVWGILSKAILRGQ